MDLYIKKKKHTIADKFTITDEKGNVVFKAKGQIISAGNKLTLSDASENDVAVIHEKKIALRKKYVIETAEFGSVEVLRKDNGRGITEFHIKELGWEVKGDFDKDNYKIYKGIPTVAHISPKLLSIGDMLKIDIRNDADMVMVISTVLVCELELED